MIESKFDELKNAFVNETKELFIKEMKDEMKKLFAKEFENIRTETNNELEEFKATLAMLQKHAKNLKRSNEELQKNAKNMNNTVDVCLRIKGLTKNTKEDANQVRDLFKEAEVEISAVSDKEHKISKENDDTIVCFTTFRHRTLFYHNRKKLKNQSIHLDLTKSRLSLLNEARKLIANNDDIAFCYADISCRCKLRFKNNDEFFSNH